MKFKINQSEIMPALGILSKLIPAKSTVDAYGMFMFSVKGNGLKVTATDGETTLCYMFKIESDTKEESKFLINATLLYNAFRELPKCEINFTFSEEKQRLLLDWGTGKSNLPVSDAKDYPLPANMEGGVNLKADAKTLADSISETVFAAEEDEMRPVMCGVLFDINEDKTTLVASNGRILSTSNPSNAESSGKGQFIVHHKPMSLLNQILAKAEGKVMMQYGEKNARFLVGNCLMNVKLIAGKYPAYHTVWPDESKSNCTLTIKKNEILGSIRRMSVYQNKEYSALSLKVEKDTVTISTSDKAVAKAKETLNCTGCKGDNLTVSLNIDYFENAVSRLPYEEIKLCIKDATTAVILANAEEKKNNSTEMIIMPSFAA